MLWHEKKLNLEPKMYSVHTALHTFKGCITRERLFSHVNSEVSYNRFTAYASQHLTDITA